LIIKPIESVFPPTRATSLHPRRSMTGGLVQRLPVTRVQASVAGSVELGLATLLPHWSNHCRIWD
jgi:hypothetical protein